MIKEGDIVSITHYSEATPFKSIINKLVGNDLTVKLTKQFAVLNFLEGDPVVLGVEVNQQIFIYSCSIAAINSKLNQIDLKVENVKYDINKRMFERFPVSFYAEIKPERSNNRYAATVKNMSQGGLLLFSKEEYELDQQLDIDVYLDKNIIFMKTMIVWRVQNANGIDYGVKITMIDPGNMQSIKKHLEIMKRDQELFIRELKG